MSDTPAGHLSRDQIMALLFASQRQLARWSSKPGLSPHQRAQRIELRRAAQVLKDDAFVRGCELRAPDAEESGDG